MQEKTRLDLAACKMGLFKSRTAAEEAIENRLVTVNGVIKDKPSAKVDLHDTIAYLGEAPSFVGRGGYKLQKALEIFDISVDGALCLDAGASTGGFTDCLLQHGAKTVYAVEGGHGQLAASLLKDARVISYEKTDIRRMPPEITAQRFDLIVGDLSFISLRLVLPHLLPLLKEQGNACLLVKPQFEVGREAIGKNGIVKAPRAHVRAIHDVMQEARRLGCAVAGLTWSPITGGSGNLEYLLWLSPATPDRFPDVDAVVRRAFEALK